MPNVGEQKIIACWCHALTVFDVHATNRYLAQVNNQKLTNAPEVFVDRQGRFFPVAYSVAPLHGGYEHGAVIVSRGFFGVARPTPLITFVRRCCRNFGTSPTRSG